MPGNPKVYAAVQTCAITVDETGTLSVPIFNTEPITDYVTVNGTKYSGSSGPTGVHVNAGSSISWSTDTSGHLTGWKVSGYLSGIHIKTV